MDASHLVLPDKFVHTRRLRSHLVRNLRIRLLFSSYTLPLHPKDGWCYLDSVPENERDYFRSCCGRFPKLTHFNSLWAFVFNNTNYPPFSMRGRYAHPTRHSDHRVEFSSHISRNVRLGAAYDLFDESAQKNAILSARVNDYLGMIRSQRVQAPYKIKKKLVPLLARAGLHEPLDTAQPHPHGFAAALELKNLRMVNELLFKKNWYGLMLRDDKLKNFSTPPSGVWNPQCEAKDIRRYRFAGGPNQPPSSPAPIWFIHDGLQNLTNSEVGQWFDDNQGLRHLVATHVSVLESTINLDSWWPQLYSSSTHGDLTRITFEDDYAGSYWQPTDSYRWVLARRLVTPAGECLHVGLVESRFGHHVSIITRDELLPFKQVSVDIPPLTQIPQHAAPGLTPQQRLTNARFYRKLRDACMTLNPKDFTPVILKARQLQMTEDELIPDAQFTAAIYGATAYALAHQSVGVLSGYHLRSMMSRLAHVSGLLPELHLRSALSADVQLAVDATNGMLASHYLVSTRRDPPAPWRTSICDCAAVPTFFIPPGATFWERYWIEGSILLLSLLVKFAIVHLCRFVFDFDLFFFTGFIQFRLGLTTRTLVDATICYFVTYLFSIPLPSFTPTFNLWIRDLYLASGSIQKLISYPLGLPSSGLNVQVGFGPLYRFSFMNFVFLLLFPNLLYPISYYVNIFLLLPCFGVLCILCVWNELKFNPIDLLPFHQHIEELFDPMSWGDSGGGQVPRLENPVPPTPPTSHPLTLNAASAASSSLLTSLNVTPPSLSMVTPISTARVHRESIHASVSRVPVPIPISPLPINISQSPAVPRTPEQHTPVAPLPPPPPYVQRRPADYDLKPYFFDTADEYSMAYRNHVLPVSPPFGNMCVWHCLSHVLRIPAAILHAHAMTTTLAPDIVNGRVNIPALPAILTYFRVSGTYTMVDDQGYASAQAVPVTFGPGIPDWPVVAWALEDHGAGDYHLTVRPPVATVNNGPAPISRTATVGLDSRFVTAAEAHGIMNIPTSGNRIMAQIANWMANPSWGSILSHSTIVQPARRPLAPLPRLPAVPLAAENLDYVLTNRDIEEAKFLARDLKTYPAELNLTDVSAQAVATGHLEIVNHYNSLNPTRPSIPITLWHGAPGTGKSTAIAAEITRLLAAGVPQSDIVVAAWTQSLLVDLERNLGPLFPNFNSHNFVYASKLLNHGAQYVFCDDAGCFWPGFLQLLMVVKTISCLYLTFDCSQATNVFPKPGSFSRQNRSTLKWLADRSTRYATLMRRSSAQNAQLFGFDGTLSATIGEIYICSKPPLGVPLLVASPRFAETKNNGGAYTMHFGGCQGVTFEGDVAIDVGGLTSSATDAAVWTALTRAKGSIWLVLSPNMMDAKTISPQGFGCSMILSSMLALACHNQTAVLNEGIAHAQIVTAAVYQHLANSIGPACCAFLGLTNLYQNQAGYYRPSASSFDKWVQSPLSHILTPKSFAPTQAVSPAFSSLSSKKYRTTKAAELSRIGTYMPFDPEDVRIPDASPPLKSWYTLEDFFDPIHTVTLTPANHLPEKVFGTHIEPTQVFEPFGPEEAQHHKGSDATLYSWSMHERVRPRAQPGLESQKVRKKAKQLTAALYRHLNTDVVPDFSADVFSECVQESISTWASGKTAVGLATILDKWDPGFSPLYLPTFLKGQWIKKIEARGTPPKKGQIVTDMHVGITLQDAPYALYMEKTLRHMLDSNVLLNSRMSTAQLMSWYSSTWDVSKPVTGNDVTGWDAGCEAEFLYGIDVPLMELLKFPQHYIDNYIHRRLNSYTHLGPFPIMQASGDRYTWLLNTYRNIAITTLYFNLPKYTVMAYSGDDAIICGHFPKDRQFIGDHWTMKFKPFWAASGPFCGWTFGLPELFISAASLAYRCRLLLQRGVASVETWRSARDALPYISPLSKFGPIAKYYISLACSLYSLPLVT